MRSARCRSPRFPAVHGAPVHIGKPELIGIADLMKSDYGDAVPVNDDEPPVFWACGVTPHSLNATVRPEFCIRLPRQHAGERTERIPKFAIM